MNLVGKSHLKDFSLRQENPLAMQLQTPGCLYKNLKSNYLDLERI